MRSAVTAASILGVLPLALALSALSPARAADADPCSALDADERAAVERVLGSVHAHDCCDETLAACLAKEKPSRLVRRLRTAVCRLIDAGRKEDEARDAVVRWGESMVTVGKPAAIDLSEVAWAGATDAPVTAVAYACARCPFCSKALPALHEDVTTGPLAGKARLVVRPFPVKGHEGSTEGALALAAARRLGVFWPYLLRLYAGFDDFSPERLPTWAAEVGVDRTRFEERMEASETRDEVVASKKEGLRLGVKATPTLFIDGYRYRGDLDRETLRDVLLEAWERRQGVACEP